MAPSQASDAFRATLELFETGVELMRQNLIRQHPQAGAAEIDRLLAEWLRLRPGAESGDCIGRSLDMSARFG